MKTLALLVASLAVAPATAEIGSLFDLRPQDLRVTRERLDTRLQEEKNLRDMLELMKKGCGQLVVLDFRDRMVVRTSEDRSGNHFFDFPASREKLLEEGRGTGQRVASFPDKDIDQIDHKAGLEELTRALDKRQREIEEATKAASADQQPCLTS
ncbi:MAG: hypothetical protein HY059_09860 [Proteobacteria bacterium]|nr:hypothetical protein [Pseudomonadota bacterium]